MEQGGVKPKEPKKPKLQSEMPGVVPAPPPKKLTPAEVYYARFLESRELQLEELGVPVTPLPDPNWARVGATIKAWQEYAQAQDPGDLKGPDRLCRWLIDDFCEDPYWAGATDQKTGEPQPYPWNALASETVWRKLIAKIEAKLEAMPVATGAA